MRRLIFYTALVFFTITNSFAFEINTHQAITRCATSTECRQDGAGNLDSFAKAALLTKQSYENEVFEGYGKSYFSYMKEMGQRVSIGPQSYGYRDLIEAGSVLEDSVYIDEDKFVKGGDGRFNNHFYAAQFNSKEACKNHPAAFISTISLVTSAVNAENMLSDKALCVGYGKRTDNISWALNDNVILTEKRRNDYTLKDAFEYYRNSFMDSEENRRKNQAKLFVSLGSMVHLIQDLHSPAHVRDGSHPLGDYLEIYGRQEGGYYLHNGNFNHGNNNDKIKNAIAEIDVNKIMLEDNKYSSYQDFYQKEALWVSENFFSEAHNDSDEDDFDTATDRDTIFDAYNLHLKKEETKEEAIPGAELDRFGNPNRWHYIKTLGNVSSVSGNITVDRNTSAIIEKGYLFDSERMMAVVDAQEDPTYNDFDKTPLEHTAMNVIPRAVASTQAFINFFFRGKIKASLKSVNAAFDSIVIDNVSDQNLVSDPNLLTFKAGTKIDVFYIDKNGKSKNIHSTNLRNDLPVGESEGIYLADVINSLGDIGDGFEIIVLMDGQIGENTGLDNYSINARGLSVAYANSRVTDSDILFSFDKSGSMGSSIESAKSSAIDILDNVVGVDNDTIFVEVDAFSSTVNVVSAYSKDIPKAKAAIQTLFSGGGTALYDAIKVAGTNAVSQKSASASSKSIIILYTDGLEGSSSSSKDDAIKAISVANSPEIDDVFLIFIGNNSRGESDLKDIADKSGRNFLSIDSADLLKQTIEDILKEG